MNDDVDWDRLSRYLAGECSEEEERQVDAWLAEDPDHYELLERLRRIWAASEMARPQDRPSAEAKSKDRERLLREIGAQQDAAPTDREARPREARAAGRLTAPFRTRAAQALLAVLLLVGGALLYTQMGSGWGSSDAPAPQNFVTARGERDTVRLDDGTRVWLSVDTELAVPTRFDDEQRHVELSGEAYFEVAPDANRPFTVRSGPAQVRVLGTKFGVTAYPADSSVQVVVREGSVAVAPEATRPEASTTLRSGQLGTLSASARRVTTRTVDASAYLGWLERRLDFHNAPLPEVARRLERWYDVEVRLQDKALTSRRLTASFDDTSAESVAQIIATTLGIDYSAQGTTIIFEAR